jgi:hypothetical protein
MKNYAKLSVLSCAIACINVSADWYESTGQAVVEQGNTAQARQYAIDDAIKRAALAAGASINSTQKVVNGVLQTEQLGITSNGAVKQLQMISENQNGNMLTVTVRVDIEAAVSACQGNTYRKPLLLSQIQLQARQDAIYGQLFNLGSDATVQLERHLRDYSPAAIVSLLPHSVTSQQLVYPDTDRLFSAGNQYILLARINDLSLGQTTSRFWQSEQKERFFALDISLYDLFEQHLVYQQEYRTSASWSENSNGKPSSHSQAFWQLPYGQKIDQVLQAVAEDVQRQLQCQPLLGSIRQVDDNQLVLELGKMHGLQTGDELQLLQLQRHPSTPGIKRIITAPISLTVTDLNERHAWATSKKLLQHIQQGDIVSIRKSSAY